MPVRPADPVRVARWGLFVLTFVNLFNYLDRFILAAVVESLKRPFPEGLGLSDTELGALATGFILVYMLTSPVFGALGDRGRRPPLIAAGVAIWSVATALGGFARGFVSLFLARSTVGVGEAAYGTVSPALLADYFPVEQRGRVFAVFSAAIPIGSAAGYMLGGFVDSRLGWRAAFFVAGVPGLLLAWLTSRLFDPPRGAQEGGVAHTAGHGVALGRQALAAYAALLRNVPYTLTVLGYAAYTFALGALAFWTPAFLERERGLAHTDATVQFGAIVVVTGFVGTFAGGWLGDRLLPRFRESYLWVSGVSALAAVPFAWMAFTAHGRGAYMTAIVIAEVLIFFSTGPVNSAIINVVEPERRAMAVALSILAIHLLGDVPSPPLIGLVSDHSSLGRALLILPVAFGVSGLIWIWAAWRGETLTPQPLSPIPPPTPAGERGAPGKLS